MFTARLPSNRHLIEIQYNGRPVSVDSAEIAYDGKRRVLILKTFDFELLRDSTCPERHRYAEILQAFGNSAKIAALEPKCSLLELNPRACDGCAQRPI